MLSDKEISGYLPCSARVVPDGDIRKLGRVGAKSFGYTLVISAISALIGITLANTIRPGERIDPTTAAGLQARYGSAAVERVEAAQGIGSSASPLMQVIETLIPSNPIAAAASSTPHLLHLMFFGLMLGAAATLVSAPKVNTLLRGFEGLYEISIKIIDAIMRWVAPYAVACLLFSNIAGFGLDLLRALMWYVVTVLLGLALHMFCVYSISVSLLSCCC